ncbi:membrane protein [Shewanella mangrovi]|uniref:Membrane protein n=1 Tax=Shewanella mangrovi TaxID=1515746 RepID=A0A094J9I3_9GAMM|nr:OmpA family protein [Shewanella mangrovi]KFZ36585.1 membrane protein [Shewanella mangrovi]
MMKLKLSYLLLIAALPAAAYAEDQQLSPWYVGIGAGQNNYGPNCEDSKMMTCGSDDPFAWEFFSGYSFNQYVAVEIGYRQLGHADWVDYANNHNDISVKGGTIGVVGTWPLRNNWSLNAEAGGYIFTNHNRVNHGDADYYHQSVAPYYGVGVGYDINENFRLSAKYRRYEDIDETRFADLDMDSNYWGLTLSYRFGEAPKAAPVVEEPAPVVMAPVDSDKDGINDDVDQCPNTPATHKVDAKGCSIYVDKLEDLTIAAQFDNNSSIVKKDSYGEIEKAANFLNKYPKADIEIAGHASLPGKESYNLWLSQKRADAVAKVLVDQYGISANRITSKGYGESQPIMQGTSAEANAANRRIEAKMSFKEKQPLLK